VVDTALPDKNPTGVSDKITISCTSGPLSDLTVYLEVDHTKIGQLIVKLEHEDTSTIVTLLDRPGYPSPGMCTGDDVDV
jgi:subtilisin-like proprotein convertase family protein